MTPTELKLDLFKKLDSFDETKIERIYGSILNIFNESETYEEWDLISEKEQARTIKSEEQFYNGQYKQHNEIISKFL